jgi:tRNA A-37 threonylcarbamoyl transferase component Bud32
MIRNEVWFYQQMFPSGYVPYCELVDENTLKTRHLGDQARSHESVTDPEAFVAHGPQILAALKEAGIRHGDLTTYAIIVLKNRPYIIDFAESRLWNDPRPDKRPEGDEYWLTRSLSDICQMSLIPERQSSILS